MDQPLLSILIERLPVMKSYLRTNNTPPLIPHCGSNACGGWTRLPKINGIPSAVHVGLCVRAYMHYIHKSIPFCFCFPRMLLTFAAHKDPSPSSMHSATPAFSSFSVHANKYVTLHPAGMRRPSRTALRLTFVRFALYFCS